MRREREEKIAKQMELDAADEARWEDDPAPVEKKSKLGVQVSIRLDPENAAVLRRVARNRRVGYTSLIRQWIVDRLREEEQPAADVLFPQTTFGGSAASRNLTVTGTVRKVEDLTLAKTG